MSLIRSLSIFIAVALPLYCQAQLVLVGLPHSQDQQTTPGANARTQALALPVWEDFSTTKTTYPDPNLWFGSRSVRVNDGLAIRPPSVQVATFDGVDSTGRPYNATDLLAKGYADKLESVAIDLSTIDVPQRNSVYLSFMYQPQGRGEAPDLGDRLLVSFRDTLKWIPVDTIENDGSLQSDKFYTSVIPITNNRFYHAGFKIRIQNFSRLSGPYDTWNVDYIYLNKGRTATDLNFPDRTISEPVTSLFGEYRVIPADHFQKDTTVKVAPTVIATSMLDFDRSGGISRQTFNFSSSVKLSYRLNNGTIVNSPKRKLDDRDTLSGAFLQKGVYRNVSAIKLPSLGPKAFEADSIGIEFVFNIDAGDNRIIDPEGDGAGDIDENEGDYDPAKWSPINFRNNDTTRASFLLLNKYAYDDGVAEYGAGLDQAGAQVAYEYNLVGVSEAYINYLDMYFPRFGDESSQLIEIRVWTDLAKEPVYKEQTALQRSQENVFWRKQILPTAVGKKFYIGWRQSTAARIAAGLDKNTDTGTRMFYNTDGAWEANTLIHGSLMLHPVFGDPPAAVDPNGLENETTLVVYPNPSSGQFRFGGSAQLLTVYDMTGRSIVFHSETTLEETIVTLPNPSQGIYIIKAYVEGVIRTAKVMVR